MKSAKVIAEIVLVPHGYQIDIMIQTDRHSIARKVCQDSADDGDESTVHTVCSDFGGDYDPEAVAETLETCLLKLMHDLETTHLRNVSW